MTVKRQLQNSLDEEGILEDQQNHLYRELREDIKKEIEEGNQILVGGDFNKTLEEEGKVKEAFNSDMIIDYTHVYQELVD